MGFFFVYMGFACRVNAWGLLHYIDLAWGTLCRVIAWGYVCRFGAGHTSGGYGMLMEARFRDE